MKSRLAVSLLFILIASTFTPNAIAAFARLRSWTSKVGSRCAGQVCSRRTSGDSALRSASKGSEKGSSADATRLQSSPKRHTQGVVCKLVRSVYYSNWKETR